MRLIRQGNGSVAYPPLEGRVGTHEAKWNARRGGVTVSQLGRGSRREAVTPPRSRRERPTSELRSSRTPPGEGEVSPLAARFNQSPSRSSYLRNTAIVRLAKLRRSAMTETK